MGNYWLEYANLEDIANAVFEALEGLVFKDIQSVLTYCDNLLDSKGWDQYKSYLELIPLIAAHGISIVEVGIRI